MHIVAKRRIIILSISVLVFNGINNADNPNIKKILNMFDPIIFPIVISDFSFRDAVIVTINSGKDVPTATTDNAIKNEGIPRVVAIEIVDCISNQAPNITAIIPSVINIIFFCIF